MRRWVALLLCDAACLFPSVGELTSPDASVSDAASDVAAEASDASAGDAADGGRFCASHPTAYFCDDFDDASTLSTAWTTLSVVDDASSFAIIQDAPVSPPNAARSTVAANVNNGQAFIGRHVSVSSGQTLSFGAAMRADAWQAGAYADVASLYVDATYAVSLVLGYNNLAPLLVVNDQPDASAASTYPVTLPQGWFRVTFVLAVSGGSSTIDLLVDGQTAIGGAKPGPPVSGGDVGMYIGLYASNYPQTIAWSFDDVYAELK